MNRSSSSSSALPWVLTVAAAVGACIYYTATSSEPEKPVNDRSLVKAPQEPQKETNGGGSDLVQVSEESKEGIKGRATKFFEVFDEPEETAEVREPPTRAARTIPSVPIDHDILMHYPTFGFDQAEADASLRDEAASITFRSAHGVQGRCDSMSLPSHAICEDSQDMAIGPGVGKAETVFNGIYDGHSGSTTSMVLQETLLPYVSWCLSREQSLSDKLAEEAMREAFLKMEARIMRPAKEMATSDGPQCSPQATMVMAPAMSGSGALVTAFEISTSTLRVALTGDSRAVLGRWCPETDTYTMEALTEDQNGFNPNEIERLDKAHPGEIDRILNKQSGKLMTSYMTRSFGDHRWKWPSDLVQSVAERFFGYEKLRGDYPTPPYLTASPVVTTHKVNPKDFLILASGGLWNHISRETAVACVARWLAAKRAGKPEEVKDVLTLFPAVGPYSYPTWGTAPEYFAIEDLDNAAVCLAKNALGGNRRHMLRGMMSLVSPFSQLARDDITIQVVFFEDPYLKNPRLESMVLEEFYHRNQLRAFDPEVNPEGQQLPVDPPREPAGQDDG